VLETPEMPGAVGVTAIDVPVIVPEVVPGLAVVVVVGSVGSKNSRPRTKPRTRSFGRASKNASTSDGAENVVCWLFTSVGFEKSKVGDPGLL
jgi:hypothetical protein